MLVAALQTRGEKSTLYHARGYHHGTAAEYGIYTSQTQIERESREHNLE